MMIHLIGDPAHDLDSIQLPPGYEVVTNDRPVADAMTLIAVSAEEGPTQQLLHQLDQWNGTRVRLLGVVLTQVQPGADPELLELVYLETCERVLPHETEVELEMLHAGSSDFQRRISDLAAAGPPEIVVGLDERAFDKPQKPWWKFW